MGHKIELETYYHGDFGEILTNPILDIAARVWEDDRYDAFRTCYRSMRWIDDLVDNRKALKLPITIEESHQIKSTMAEWIESVRSRRLLDPFRKSFAAILDRFNIPFWPWERFLRAMIYDLHNEGYRSHLSFLRYCEGAAIAPASVFVHLCGVQKNGPAYMPPAFDIRRAARPLALFSYTVHIIRDFQKDMHGGLCYFADNILDHFGLTQDKLQDIAHGGAIPSSFRNMIALYKKAADHYRNEARGALEDYLPHLTDRYRLSMELVYSLYQQIFDRINPAGGDFTAAELNPSPGEVRLRINRTLETFHAPA